MRAAAVGGALAVCGLAILLIVRAETGTEGFLIGLLLAVVPVPLLITGFRWLDRIEPTPWRSLAFAFAWGACTATLVAVVANTFATEWLTSTVITSPDTDADFVGAVFVAPITEELAKVAAILLLFLHRPRQFTGLLSGIVVAGVVATGFAFTENILYIGSAYGEDQEYGVDTVSATATTFFVRILMSPFAHPLFTIMAGLGFGLAATRAADRRLPRVLYPLLGLLGAIGLHALWNGTASLNGFLFLAAYALLMAPLCGGLIWLSVRQRNKLLRTVRSVLPHYAAQGWLTPQEAYGLGSMSTRWAARDAARRERGSAAARIVEEYQNTATALALLRSRAALIAVAEFTEREGALLERLLEQRPLGSPYTTRASQPRPLYY
ncbi:PrsW family intramembrane metalloprotease, partial [Streptomyces sp. P38-E01]|nr:PrsW family intramembrane metalloprotease [Streptomyces tardus]